MGWINKITGFALANNPVAKAVSRMRAASGGHLYSDQAISQYNDFFDKMMRIDTDEILSNIGMSRHQLSILLGDDEIDEKVERRIENLTQASYTLNPSEDDAAAFVYEQLDKHLEHILLASMDAKLYGYSVCEWVWDKDTYNQTGVVLPLRLTQKPMQWFEPKNDGRLLYFKDNTFTPIEVDTRYKYMLIQHRATFDNPKGKALLSRVYWLWYFKKNGWTFWSKFLERFGSPLLVGSTPNDTQAMAGALAEAHSQSIFVMPEGETVEAVASQGNGETFKVYDDALSRRIAKYLLGQTLTSGTDQGGTAGQGGVHQDQQEIVFNSDKRFAIRYVQQFIDVICELKGFDAPQFEFRVEKGIQDDLATRDVKLTNQGVEFTIDYYSDRYDIDKKYIKQVGTPKTLPKVETGNVSAKAQIPNFALLNFKADQDDKEKFTPEQQELEKLVDYALVNGQQPLDSKAILAVIKDSKDTDELTERLFDMVGQDLDESEFSEFIATALMVADIHGLTDETVGK